MRSRLGLLLPAVAVGAILGLDTLHAQAPSVNVQFVNATQGERDSTDMWVNFSDGGAPVIDPGTGIVTYNSSASIGTATINGNLTNIFTNTSYQLSTVQDGMFSISGFGGGRGYVSYGSALTNISQTPQIGPYAGWQPPPAVPDPNFTVRFQAFELTIQPVTTGTAGSYQFGTTNQAYADLSYIDQIGISTGIQVQNAPVGATNTTQTSQNTQALVNAVAVYQADAASPTNFTAGTNVVTQASSPQPQYVQVAGVGTGGYQNPGSTSIANPAPDLATLSNFVRVAGPGQMPAVSEGGITSLYPSWSPYITAVSPGGSLYQAGIQSTALQGTYGPTGQPAQTYLGTATFNTGTINLGGTDYTGYVLITGITYNSVAQDDIVIPFSSLTAATGLYGTNPSYATGTSGNYSALNTVPGNTLQTRIAGDVVAGMNFGFLGSTVEQSVITDSMGNPIMIGLLDSADWWTLGTLNPEYLFEGAQPDFPYYNTYSAALLDLTTAYTFGIQDRLGQNTTEFNLTSSGTGTVLQFLIQPDLIPEPTSAMLVGLGIGLAMLRRKRPQASR